MKNTRNHLLVALMMVFGLSSLTFASTCINDPIPCSGYIQEGHGCQTWGVDCCKYRLYRGHGTQITFRKRDFITGQTCQNSPTGHSCQPIDSPPVGGGW